MIYYNNMEILEHINSVPEYFDHLFENFQTNLKDSIGFLYELQTLVKNMFQMEPKIEYSSKLITKNIFSHITNSLNQLINNPENVDDPSIRNILKINLIEIMSFVIQINPNAFINYLLNNQQDSQTFVQAIVYLLKTGDQGLQIQISEILKYLLDPGLEKKVEIQDFMYDHFFPEFHKHFLMFEKNEIYYSFVQQYIEILIFCIKSHGYRIRHYIIQQKIIQDLLKGINQPEKTLSLAVIRFIKSVIIGRDEFLIKYLAQNNIFDDIFEVYFKNANKDNLIKSALLELLNLPPKENIKKLIHHLVERYKDKIIEHKLEKNFEKLFIKYDQITANENHINESEQSQNTVPVSQTQFTAV